MKLTAENVRAVLKECFFKDGEDRSNAVIADAITAKFGFHPGRLASHKQDIASMLGELPEQFFDAHGGGTSFLNACITRDGEHWGEHPTMELLLALGIATQQVELLLPRVFWKELPGGMPYFKVTIA